jgi:prolyl-tRNA synthetase
VLLDDRSGVSVGVKFKDAELIGVPLIVVVGRGLVDGLVEVRNRETGDRSEVALGAVVGQVAASLGNS